MYGSPWPRVYANVSERDIRPTISRSGTRRRVSCVLQSEDKLPAGAGQFFWVFHTNMYTSLAAW
jgi:hypothetical protein